MDVRYNLSRIIEKGPGDTPRIHDRETPQHGLDETIIGPRQPSSPESPGGCRRRKRLLSAITSGAYMVNAETPVRGSRKTQQFDEQIFQSSLRIVLRSMSLG